MEMFKFYRILVDIIVSIYSNTICMDIYFDVNVWYQQN